MRYILISAALLFVSAASIHAEEMDPAEILLGERLFLETRFAQYFNAHLDQDGSVNQEIKAGDPALNKTVRFSKSPSFQTPFTDGPYAGQSFNCRSCHLVDEHLDQSELGMRSYSDFASRSPLPTRDDGKITTVRNSPALVDASLPRENFILHFDAEFSSLPQLVRGTLTGRNLGWLPNEKKSAIQHICQVAREDDGNNDLAKEFGGYSYTDFFLGKNAQGEPLADEYLLPETLRTDIQRGSCNDVFSNVANLIAIYTEDLVFAQDASILSPYDLFLQINNLPAKPNEDETDVAYSKGLMQQIQNLDNQEKLLFVEKNPNTKNGNFQFHDQPYQFGAKQLAGMRVFFNQNSKDEISNGSCIACHAAPHFTDFGLHNTGITQVEYDAIHGLGTFNKLAIPNLEQRNKEANLYLPATQQNPKRQSIFRSIPTKINPIATDLGAWNIFYNADYPKSQQRINNLICNNENVACESEDQALARSIATFKTPGLRNLGHSAPYMHNGQISDLHAVLSFYITAAASSRQGMFRNADAEISSIQIEAKDINPLVLFLISLNEDYN